MSASACYHPIAYRGKIDPTQKPSIHQGMRRSGAVAAGKMSLFDSFRRSKSSKQGSNILKFCVRTEDSLSILA